jgi:hypothetical protein
MFILEIWGPGEKNVYEGNMSSHAARFGYRTLLLSLIDMDE